VLEPLSYWTLPAMSCAPHHFVEKTEPEEAGATISSPNEVHWSKNLHAVLDHQEEGHLLQRIWKIVLRHTEG